MTWFHVITWATVFFSFSFFTSFLVIDKKKNEKQKNYPYREREVEIYGNLCAIEYLIAGPSVLVFGHENMVTFIFTF